MKDFKDSTKTQYAKGGCGCGPKGAAKVAAVTAAFKKGQPVVKKAEGGAVTRGNRMQALEAREEAKLLREARREAPRKAGPARSPVVQRDAREPLIRGPLMDRLSSVPSQRGEMPIRRKCGGLAVKK